MIITYQDEMNVKLPIEAEGKLITGYSATLDSPGEYSHIEDLTVYLLSAKRIDITEFFTKDQLTTLESIMLETTFEEGGVSYEE